MVLFLRKWLLGLLRETYEERQKRLDLRTLREVLEEDWHGMGRAERIHWAWQLLRYDETARLRMLRALAHDLGRLRAISDLIGEHTAVMANMDITRGYPKPLPGRMYLEVGNRAGMAHVGPGSGYPDYSGSKKENTK